MLQLQYDKYVGRTFWMLHATNRPCMVLPPTSVLSSGAWLGGRCSTSALLELVSRSCIRNMKYNVDLPPIQRVGMAAGAAQTGSGTSKALTPTCSLHNSTDKSGVA
jgi:hypothetical protein